MLQRGRSGEEGLEVLTDEQRRLLELLGEGLSVTEAAKRIHLSERTAERRLAEARARLGAATNAQAVSLAHERPGEAGTVGGILTRREREVLVLVAGGLHNDEIAAQLGIAPSTVAALLRTSMAKLGARTRAEAAARLAETNDDECLTLE